MLSKLFKTRVRSRLDLHFSKEVWDFSISHNIFSEDAEIVICNRLRIVGMKYVFIEKRLPSLTFCSTCFSGVERLHRVG